MAPRGRRGNAPPSYGSANNGGGMSSNLIVMIAVSLASFFAGSLFSLQAAIGNQAISESCPSAADIESIVASRVKEGELLRTCVMLLEHVVFTLTLLRNRMLVRFNHPTRGYV